MNTIFTNIEQAQVILGNILDGNVSLQQFNSYVLPVVNKLTSVIGNQVYTDLVQYVHGTDSDTDKNQLVLYCRPVLAYFAAAQGIKLSALLSNQGSIVITNMNTQAAGDEQIKVQSTALLANAFALREMLLNFIYENKATQTAAYNAAFDQSLFLWSARQLNALQSANLEENDFMEVRDLIRTEEQTTLRGELGLVLFNTLKSEHKAQTYTGNNYELLEKYVLPYLCCVAMQHHNQRRKQTETATLYKGQSRIMLQALVQFVTPTFEFTDPNSDTDKIGTFGMI